MFELGETLTGASRPSRSSSDAAKAEDDSGAYMLHAAITNGKGIATVHVAPEREALTQQREQAGSRRRKE